MSTKVVTGVDLPSGKVQFGDVDASWPDRGEAMLAMEYPSGDLYAIYAIGDDPPKITCDESGNVYLEVDDG
ncbi:MAG: hypothetical protein WAY93_05720 [Atopobiaceae bacterium]|jgi:hypothetical protein|nr:hypothetical protein [Atopobiaceae bacterium]